MPPRRAWLWPWLPFPLLAAYIAAVAPQLGLQYSPWNYWYVLLMPVTGVLVAATAANGDARMGNRALLSSGVPLARAWGAKVTWCLALSLLSNLIVFAIYALLALAVPQGAANAPAMLAVQLGFSFGWSVVPFWPACPPAATIMLPTAFLPVLPSGEPASAGMALVESIGSGDVALALAAACALTAVLAIAGAVWLSGSEELR